MRFELKATGKFELDLEVQKFKLEQLNLKKVVYSSKGLSFLRVPFK